MGRVLVAGSINMDVVATATRHPRIGETVAGQAISYLPGGKGANQAVAAARQGVATRLIGRLGQDSFGVTLRSFLTENGVDLTLVADTVGAHTGTALITIAEADNTIVVVPGANGLVSLEDVNAVPLAAGDVAVSQFEIPIPSVQAFFAGARRAGATTVLNPAPMADFPPQFANLVDVLVLNETELGLLARANVSEADDPVAIARIAATQQSRADQTICVTLGRRGVVAVIAGETLIVPGRQVKAIDATGAGDCFVGVLAAQLAQQKSVKDAIGTANAAAAICVQRMGAAPSMPTATEVAEFIAAKTSG